VHFSLIYRHGYALFVLVRAQKRAISVHTRHAQTFRAIWRGATRSVWTRLYKLFYKYFMRYLNLFSLEVSFESFIQNENAFRSGENLL
jgi:hypothetical protein